MQTPLNFIEQVLIEKAGHDNGFENAQPSSKECVVLSSARHRAVATICKTNNQFQLEIKSSVLPQLVVELARSFPNIPQYNHHLLAADIADLDMLLNRTAQLAQALPSQPINNFVQQVKEEQAKYVKDSIQNTEIDRLIKQRVGQNIFRNALLDYWGALVLSPGLI